MSKKEDSKFSDTQDADIATYHVLHDSLNRTFEKLRQAQSVDFQLQSEMPCEREWNDMVQCYRNYGASPNRDKNLSTSPREAPINPNEVNSGASDGVEVYGLIKHCFPLGEFFRQCATRAREEFIQRFAYYHSSHSPSNT